MSVADQVPKESLREKVTYGLIGALGRMAEKLSEKKLSQATEVLTKVRDLDISDTRRIGAETRAAKLADDAIKLERSAGQARDFVGDWAARR